MSNNSPPVSYYCTIEVTPRGSFPVGTMLTVASMKDILPTISAQEYDSNTTQNNNQHQDAVLNMDVVVDFSGYIVGGDATDELMEVCALSMRSALQSQLDLSITNGHHLHSCHVVYKCIHFRDCGLFQYPMQRIVEGLLGVVPEVLFDVLVPPIPQATIDDVNDLSGEVTATSETPVPSSSHQQHQQQRCILNVCCESLDFGVNLFHTEYLTAFADELAWVVGSTSRLSRGGNTALLDLAHCTIGLNYCTEITPSNVCQIVGTCLRAQATPSTPSVGDGSEMAPRRPYPFSIDVSGGTMVPLMPATKTNNNGVDESGVLDTSDTLLTSPMALRRGSTFRLVVLSPKGEDDGSTAMDTVEHHVQSSSTTSTTSQCWRLQLLETLEYELLYLVGDGLLPSDGSNLPSVALDGFLDFPEGYTLQHNNGNNNNNDHGDVDTDVRLLEFNADDGGASLRAILSSFAAEFPTACRCIRVPITAQRAVAAVSGVAAAAAVVVGTVHDEVSNEDMHLSSSASPHRHDRKPLEETSSNDGVPLLSQSASQPSPALNTGDATLKWCSIEDVVHIVTAEVAHNGDQQHRDEEEEVAFYTTLTNDECSLVSVSTATDHHHSSPEQQHRRQPDDDSQLNDANQECSHKSATDEEADDQHTSNCGQHNQSADGSAILATSTTSALDHHHHPTPVPSKHLSPIDHSRLIPPSRRRLAHAAHSLAETESGLGACVDSCLHTTTTSPSRSTVGPCRGGGAASRSISPPQHHHTSSPAVVAHTSPSSRSLSPSRTATDVLPTTVVATSEEPVASTPPPSPSGQTIVVVAAEKVNMSDDTSEEEESEVDEEEEVVVRPTHRIEDHRDMQQHDEDDPHSPSQDRTYSQDRAGSLIPMTPNHLNSTLPPGTNNNATTTPTAPPIVVNHQHTDPRSLSRVSSIAPTRTTSPTNAGGGGVDGRSISPHHLIGGSGFSRSASSVGEGGTNTTTIVAGSTARPTSVRMVGGGKSWEAGTVYMMSDVEHYGFQQHHHRHQKPSSKTVISTVHIHQQHPHNAPRLESTSRSNSAASGSAAVSRVASLSPVPCQPYTTTSISRRGSTTNVVIPGGAGVVSRTASIALERQVDIPPNVQVHSLKSVSARVHPNALLVASKPSSSSVAAVPTSTVTTTTPAANKKPVKKLKKTTKKKSTSSKKASSDVEATSAIPAPTTPSFFQGLLDRHERIKTDLALKGGVHRVRKSSMTTVTPTPCLADTKVTTTAAITSAATSSRVASISPVPLIPTSASTQQQVLRTHHAEVAASPQDGADSLADAVRHHNLLYAPRPIPLPVTEQCQAGLARCISSRRSSSIVTDIHARCSSKGPRRSGTPRGSQPTSRSSSAAAAAPHVPTPSAFIDTMAPINVVKEVHRHTESPQSCWSEGGVEGMQMSRSPSCQHPDTTTTPTATTAPPTEVAPAVVAVHRTSSVQVRVRRPSLRQN